MEGALTEVVRYVPKDFDFSLDSHKIFLGLKILMEPVGMDINLIRI